MLVGRPLERKIFRAMYTFWKKSVEISEDAEQVKLIYYTESSALIIKYSDGSQTILKPEEVGTHIAKSIIDLVLKCDVDEQLKQVIVYIPFMPIGYEAFRRMSYIGYEVSSGIMYVSVRFTDTFGKILPQSVDGFGYKDAELPWRYVKTSIDLEQASLNLLNGSICKYNQVLNVSDTGEGNFDYTVISPDELVSSTYKYTSGSKDTASALLESFVKNLPNRVHNVLLWGCYSENRVPIIAYSRESSVAPGEITLLLLVGIPSKYRGGITLKETEE